MKKISAGLLMYRKKDHEVQVFLVHPGGPFFKNKDMGYWGIPKGEPNENEPLIEAAKREFEEETGLLPGNNLIPLGTIQQKSGKIVHGWAFEGDWDGVLKTKSFTNIEWPLKSGKKITIPEVDKGEFFPIEIAKKKIVPEQKPLLEKLIVSLTSD